MILKLGTPSELYFQCVNHGYMGDAAYTSLGTATSDDAGNLSITPSYSLVDASYNLNLKLLIHQEIFHQHLEH